MKKPTCTFPAFKYKILSKKDKVEKGDLYNYRNPILKSFDYWSDISTPDNFPGKGRKGWIIIRKNPVQIVNGLATWQHQEGDKYLATGKDRNGKRFRRENEKWVWIAGINVWNGNKYLVRDGKRYKIQSVTN